jgi:hypothetical protein
VAVEVLVIAFVVYTPPGNALFGTAPLGLADWLFMLPFAIGLVVIEEARKAIARRLRASRVRSAQA